MTCVSKKDKQENSTRTLATEKKCSELISNLSASQKNKIKNYTQKLLRPTYSRPTFYGIKPSTQPFMERALLDILDKYLQKKKSKRWCNGLISYLCGREIISLYYSFHRLFPFGELTTLALENKGAPLCLYPLPLDRLPAYIGRRKP